MADLTFDPEKDQEVPVNEAPPPSPTRRGPKTVPEEIVFKESQKFAELALGDEFSIEQQVQFLEIYRRLESQAIEMNKGVSGGES